MNRCAVWIRGFLLAALVALGLPAMAGHADSTVESTFSQPGPWAVTEQRDVACCDSTGAAYDIWYPTDLGANGFRHPIITWGDGTNAHPGQYDYLLRHFASWGFVVIATENSATGSGVDIAGAVDALLGLAADPASAFHDKLNPDAVGAVGHSQGATGVLNAMANSGGRIATAVPIELPAQMWCFNGSCPDPGRVTRGSVFLVNGSADTIISPSEQALPPQAVGLQSERAYYDALPASIPKAWGTLVGPNHNDVQGQPDCANASWPCTTGVYGYLGYPTAWLAARLLGNADAARAFAGSGEFLAPNPAWANQTSDISSP
ncbi:alpha/beta hydrolase [Nocardia sp. ET3-3]|uniref:Alpha/beta hydrolase n=1 Tax=Nocardia terrae TaxID=2675851 RepID=A0A7K1UQS1_9NOCA|nr:alpha/beta hydrolase [Nocardia terrae]MVU76700.1 alpha/beta hydrolase [Nocardia terrae]